MWDCGLNKWSYTRKTNNQYNQAKINCEQQQQPILTGWAPSVLHIFTHSVIMRLSQENQQQFCKIQIQIHRQESVCHLPSWSIWIDLKSYVEPKRPLDRPNIETIATTFKTSQWINVVKYAFKILSPIEQTPWLFQFGYSRIFYRIYRIINIETQKTNIVMNNSLAQCFNVSAIAIAMTKVSGST